MTAYTARYKDAELEAYGGDAVVHKPVNPDELTAAIWKILNEHRIATIAAQKRQLEAEKHAREIQERAFQEIQLAHEKLSEELRIRQEVEGELASMQAELKEAGLKLKEAQKLATYGELLASIAHEINTPLSGGDVSEAFWNRKLERLNQHSTVFLATKRAKRQRASGHFSTKSLKRRERAPILFN